MSVTVKYDDKANRAETAFPREIKVVVTFSQEDSWGWCGIDN